MHAGQVGWAVWPCGLANFVVRVDTLAVFVPRFALVDELLQRVLGSPDARISSQFFTPEVVSEVKR